MRDPKVSFPDHLFSAHGVSGAGISKSLQSINADYAGFLMSDNNDLVVSCFKQAGYLDLFDARYASSASLLIVLHAKSGDIFTEDRLKAIVDLTDASWELPYAVRVESISSSPHLSSDIEGLTIEDMFTAEQAADPEAVKSRVMDDVVLRRRLISDDARTAGVNVVVDYPMTSSVSTTEIIDAAKELVAEVLPESLDLDVWYGGRVASSKAFSQASRNDLLRLMPVAFLIFLALLSILLQSFSAGSALFFCAFFGAISALGLAGWSGVQINAGTAHIPTVIIALGVAALSHIVLAARRAAAKGATPKEAVVAALKSDANPVAVTLGTTFIGFMTLVSADAPPIRDVGRFVAIGALFCLFYGLVLLPVWLRWSGLKVHQSSAFIGWTVAACSQFITSRNRALLFVLPALGAIMLGGIAFIKIDDTFPDYFSKKFEFRQHADLIEQNLTGLEVIEFDVGSPREGTIYEAAFIDKLESFEAWLKEQPKVSYVTSILEVYRRLHKHMNAEEVTSVDIPRDRNLLAQYILLYEMSLPMGQELTNNVTIDKSRSRVSVIMQDASTRDVRALRERAEQWLQTQHAEDISGPGTGLAVMYAYLTSLNVETMLGGSLMALALISAILIIALRSFRYGLISLLPNLAPAALAFGVWGYFVGEVGIAVSVVGAMSLGIIVDDTVHILWRYREARRRGMDADVAVREMFSKVGEPMLISTIALVCGFGVLMVSGFYVNSSIGILTSATIGIALMLDWFFLAPLLIAVDREKQPAASPLELAASDAALVAQAREASSDSAKAAG